jgi:hypothetical protein
VQIAEAEDEDVRLIHRVGDQDLPFELAEESAGTSAAAGNVCPV